MRPNRFFIFVCLVLVLTVVLPVSKSVNVKSSLYSALEGPLSISRNVAQTALDLAHFASNAEEVRQAKRSTGARGSESFQLQEVLAENSRLNKLLEMKAGYPVSTSKAVVGRVIGRSPAAWNRVFLIDKGTTQGMRVNMPVLSDKSIIGKIIETGSEVSKALLITDPNSRVGALVQRTRDQGILYGTFSGECRMKYLSLDAKLEPGDWVESAGYGGSFPKGLVIGTIEKVWKEPGQIYQVALVKPVTDISRVEEVVCIV